MVDEMVHRDDQRARVDEARDPLIPRVEPYAGGAGCQGRTCILKGTTSPPTIHADSVLVSQTQRSVRILKQYREPTAAKAC